VPRQLTQDFVNSVVLPHGRKLIADKHAKGLYLDLWPKGRAWRFRYTGLDGKMKALTIGDATVMPLEEARQQAKALGVVRKQRKEAHLIKPMPTYRSYLEETYFPYCRATKRSGKEEQRFIRTQLMPAFGDLPLHEVTKALVAGFVNERIARGYQPTTVNKLLAHLKTSMNKAIEWEIGGLQISPIRGLKLLKAPPRIDRFLDPEEGQRLIQAVHQSDSPLLRFIIPFLLFTGARKREALNAEWRYIDLESRIWTIPETKAGKPRFVPLSDQALEVVKAAQTFLRGTRQANSRWLFPNLESGRPYTSIFYPWDVCRKAAGLPDVRIHDLRHSFASALVNRGMTLYDVKELLGHANVLTTQRYAHLSKARLREAAQEAGKFYSSNSCN
jgi:integrase